MTVYVDDMHNVALGEYRSAHTRGRTYKMSHMIADTDEELHAMADSIGVARRWFQGDHYDITKSRRQLAVQKGAVEVSMRVLSAMAMNVRRGCRMGTPTTAQEIASFRRLYDKLCAKGLTPSHPLWELCGDAGAWLSGQDYYVRDGKRVDLSFAQLKRRVERALAE